MKFSFRSQKSDRTMPGELYFLKVVIVEFGITDEGDSDQFSYVIPEYEFKHFGKGSIATCSYLFHKINNLT